MQKYEDNLTARINGNNLQPLLGATVTVTSLDTGLPASLYSDNGVTPLAQPLATDNNGYFGFYAPDGKYTLTFSGSRFATFTREIVLEDPADNPYVTVTNLAAGQGAAGIGFGSRTVDNKLRDVVSIKDRGFVGDWNGTTGTDNSAALIALLADTNVRKIIGAPGKYWFGTIPSDTALATVTRDIDVDWNGAELVCAEPTSGSSSNTALVKFTDCRVSMRNYIFDDTSFAFGGLRRGVLPLLIHASTKTTKGHTIGPFHIKRGQSLLTCISDNPNSYRSQQITLVGSCTADSAYYGINCANNGDGISGSYRIGMCNRALFAYGVDDVNVQFTVDAGDPASANILISNSGIGFPATQNIKVHARVGTLNAPVTIADQPSAAGSGSYRNIDLTLLVDALGSNISAGSPLVRFGSYDVSGAYETVDRTISMNNIHVDLRANPSIGMLDEPVKVYTPSPNYGLFTFSRETPYTKSSLFPKNAAGAYMGPVINIGGRVFRSVSGNLTNANAVVLIPSKYLVGGMNNEDVNLHLRIQARNGVGGSSEYAIREYMVSGYLNGSGDFTLVSATQTASQSTGSLTPVATVSGASDGLRVSMNTYTGTFAQLTASVQVV